MTRFCFSWQIRISNTGLKGKLNLIKFYNFYHPLLNLIKSKLNVILLLINYTYSLKTSSANKKLWGFTQFIFPISKWTNKKLETVNGFCFVNYQKSGAVGNPPSIHLSIFCCPEKIYRVSNCCSEVRDPLQSSWKVKVL